MGMNMDDAKAEIAKLCKSLKEWKNDGHWEGTAFVPFWGGAMEFCIDYYTEDPPALVNLVRTILTYPNDLRGPIAEVIVADYHREPPYELVDYGTDKDGNDRGPTVAPRDLDTSNVWSYLSEPRLLIYAWENNADEARFSVGLDCTWDTDHGVGVRFKRFQIVESGAQGDVVY